MLGFTITNRLRWVPKGYGTLNTWPYFWLPQPRKGDLLYGRRKRGCFNQATNTSFQIHPFQCVELGDRRHSSVGCCWLWDPATIAPNYPLLWMTRGASILTPFLLWGIKGWTAGRRPLVTAVTKPAFRGTSSRNKLPHDFSTLSNQRDTVTTGLQLRNFVLVT